MKIKLVNEDFRDNYGIKLLQSKGIQDVDKYINPTKECLQNPIDLNNFEDGAKLLKTAIEKEWNILLIIDSDNDLVTIPLYSERGLDNTYAISDVCIPCIDGIYNDIQWFVKKQSMTYVAIECMSSVIFVG